MTGVGLGVSYKSLVLGVAIVLSACGARIVPPSAPAARAPTARVPAPVRQPVAATPLPPVTNLGVVTGGANAASAGLAAGPSVESLAIDPARAAAALAAFRTSCRELMRRSDASGLTRGTDWQPACAAAQSASDRDAARFFASNFETVQVGDGKAFATGYYIPEIEGSLSRRSGYDVPIYGRPSDLIDVDLGKFSDALKGKSIRGRVDGRTLVPYYDRTQIESGAMTAAPIIGWAADPVALFFLQVQGSGILRQPDGSTVRIGYDSQNGREYTGIGALMRTQGLLQPGHASMQDIVAYLRANPDQGREIMRANKSYVFFRLLDGPPLGAMGLPVIGGVSAATDPRFIPLGAPVFLSMDRTDATGLWIAQDTGGAIKGANRVDTFWGAGADAEAIAGGMSAHGTAFVLVPIGTLARLQGGASGATPQP
ncbi:murein transglycosylase A [Sphingomonas sp.]|uniref:murein transglycosylase A n=1 Tax=Sphingomonas sp. TaxID=28214 RepID=UPI002E2FF312|nr:murein transglycosylase A [Sphingomonas sp.]HEX4695881.1 murein transglycosylase A [Sphingomonas sp.]